MTLNSSPGGFDLVLNGSQAAAPFTRTVIQGSRQHDLRAFAADEGQEAVAVQVVVGRRRADSRHHREQLGDLHRDLDLDLEPAARRGRNGDPDTGPAPLTVQFDGSGSSDPDAGDSLSYAWDLDGDGQFDDSTAVAPSHTYASQGVHTASLRVTDSHDASSTAAVTVTAGNSPPSATIDPPAPGTSTPTPLVPLPPPLLPPGSDADTSPPRLRFRAYVTGVIDGDTIRVRRGLRRYTVRLIGIETPETRKPGTSVECGRREATSRMFRLGFTRPRDSSGDGLYDRRGGKGRRVRVTTDPSQGLRDRFGRLLAYVASARGGFAKAQLRAGWASVYVSGKPFERLATFQAAEASAREDSRGIWAQCRPARKRPSA